VVQERFSCKAFQRHTKVLNVLLGVRAEGLVDAFLEAVNGPQIQQTNADDE
jgi:hypothetical protein